MARRRSVVAFVLLVVTAFSLGVVASASAGLSSQERTVVVLINRERARRGLPCVAIRANLCRAAEAHSAEMMRLQYFAHRSAGGAMTATRVIRAGYGRTGYRSWAVAELIGYGYGLAGTPRAMVSRWMDSKLHRAKILDPRWRDIGVGRVTGTFRGIENVAIYTVDLGRRIR